MGAPGLTRWAFLLFGTSFSWQQSEKCGVSRQVTWGVLLGPCLPSGSSKLLHAFRSSGH